MCFPMTGYWLQAAATLQVAGRGRLAKLDGDWNCPAALKP